MTYVFKSKKQHFSQNLRWIVLALLVVAMARPVLPQSVSFKKVQAHSLILALDLSVSMNANDIQPTRAKASRQSIKVFLQSNKQEQVALIGFTINPLLLCPSTTDHALVQMALETMNPEYILTKGTDLKKLLEKVAAFNKDEEKKLVLFTDGGNEVLDTALLEFVQENNIRILAMGMATEQGSSIELKDATVVQDKEGHIVVSKLNASLRDLAEQSGGKFVPFVTVAKSVESIEAWLESFSKNDGLKRESRSYFELAFVPLLLALLLFFFSATRFSKKLALLLLLIGVHVQAETLLEREHWGEGAKALKVEPSEWGLFDGYYLQQAYATYGKEEYVSSLKSLYKMKNRGLAGELLLAHIYYKEEKYKKAKSVLEGIKSSNIKLKQQLYFELGNCAFKMAYWNRAKEYYVKALQLGEDEDAKENLELVIFQKKVDASKVGFINPSGAELSSGAEENVEETEEKNMSEKKESAGGSGGSDSKQSKQSTVKVVKSNENKSSKRVMSSKAYDLINEGYIREEKPW
jgi:Ca-activated chloride channel family protein